MTEYLSRSPDIYRINVPLPNNPLRCLNAYVIRTDQHFFMIDTGFRRKECREAIFAGIRDLNIDLARTILFLTHFHADHTGLAGDLVNLGCTAYMGGIDYEYLRRVIQGETWPYFEAKFAREGFPAGDLRLQTRENQARLYAAETLFPVNTVEDGQSLILDGLVFRFVHTPGHTPGHMAVYLPAQRILFTGDHVLFDITPNISPWAFSSQDALGNYLTSLDRIRAFPVQTAYPAHREVHTQISKRILEIKAHHQNRLFEILAAAKKAPGSTAYDIAGMISWSVHGLSWENLPSHQKWFAMAETLAHIDHLLVENRLVKDEDSDVNRYFFRSISVGKELAL